jgi:hypothetical protein
MLLATLIIVLVVNNNRAKTPTTIMTCSVNPHVQFVLNAKNEVMQVVALNKEGQAVTLQVDFVGLDAEDAAEMFVKVSTEAGYIDANTTGTKVTFDLNGSKKNYDKLEEKIVSQVNAYFDENGIIAGAITSVTEDLKEAIKTLKPNAIDIDEKNIDELMDHYLQIAEMINGIEANRLDNFYKSYNDIYDKFCEDKQAEEDKFALVGDLINEIIQREYNTNISSIINKYNEDKNHLLETYKKQGKTALEELKKEIQSKVTAYANILNEHKVYFENNRETINAKIAEFRATLQA